MNAMKNINGMKNYYHDAWIEDGFAPSGVRETGYRMPEKRNRRRFGDVVQGESLPVLEQGPVTRTHIVKYAGASFDFNPIHHDEEFAKRARSGGIIAHGMMIMGYLGKCATAYLGTAQFDRFTSRNLAITRPGDVMIIEGRVEEKRPGRNGGTVRISLTAKNKANGQLLCTGEVTATLD
jgi:acyl dehydratase